MTRLLTTLVLLLTTHLSAAETLTNTDVIALHQAGLSSDVIVQKISASTCRFTTDTESLIALKKAGVPDAVVTAMLRATAPAPTQAATSPAAASGAVQAASFHLYQRLCTIRLSVQTEGIVVTPIEQCRGNPDTYTWDTLRAVCITAWDENPGKPRGGRTPFIGSRKGSLYLHFKDGGMWEHYTAPSSKAVRNVRDHIAKYKPALTEACDATYD